MTEVPEQLPGVADRVAQWIVRQRARPMRTKVAVAMTLVLAGFMVRFLWGGFVVGMASPSFVLPVMAITLLFGVWLGLASALAGGTLAAWAFIEPVGAIALGRWTDTSAWVVLGLACMAAAVLTEVLWLCTNDGEPPAA